ncbi:MAG: lipopolysaccharide transport periplasmic protein LptA [Pseudomonadota bacterium]
MPLEPSLIKNAKPLLLVLCLLHPLPGAALSTDKDQPINIEADSVDIDDRQGISIYKGNVIMTQGSMRLDADVVTVYSPDRVVQKAVAEGNPARYKQRPDNKDDDIRAKSQRMEYYADTEKLILLEGAHLWQEKNEFSGNRIDYDIKRDVVNARKAPSGKERVQVIIPPKPKNTPAKP